MKPWRRAQVLCLHLSRGLRSRVFASRSSRIMLHCGWSLRPRSSLRLSRSPFPCTWKPINCYIDYLINSLKITWHIRELSPQDNINVLAKKEEVMLMNGCTNLNLPIQFWISGEQTSMLTTDESMSIKQGINYYRRIYTHSRRPKLPKKRSKDVARAAMGSCRLWVPQFLLYVCIAAASCVDGWATMFRVMCPWCTIPGYLSAPWSF